MNRRTQRQPAPQPWHLPPSSAVSAHGSAGMRILWLLVQSYPEPIESADLARRLGLSPFAVSWALLQLIKDGQAKRSSPMVSRWGYAYTVTQ